MLIVAMTYAVNLLRVIVVFGLVYRRLARTRPFCAERKMALSLNLVSGAHAHPSALSSAAVDAVHRITTDASRITESAYTQILAAGLSAGGIR